MLTPMPPFYRSPLTSPHRASHVRHGNHVSPLKFPCPLLWIVPNSMSQNLGPFFASTFLFHAHPSTHLRSCSMLTLPRIYVLSCSLSHVIWPMFSCFPLYSILFDNFQSSPYTYYQTNQPCRISILTTSTVINIYLAYSYTLVFPHKICIFLLHAGIYPPGRLQTRYLPAIWRAGTIVPLADTLAGRSTTQVHYAEKCRP